MVGLLIDACFDLYYVKWLNMFMDLCRGKLEEEKNR